MAKRKKEKSSILSRRKGETSLLKEKKERPHPLLEEMAKNERTWFQYYMKTRQVMQAQDKLLRAHWRKVDRIVGRVPTRELPRMRD